MSQAPRFHDPIMIHEVFLKLTENAFVSHPCSVISIKVTDQSVPFTVTPVEKRQPQTAAPKKPFRQTPSDPHYAFLSIILHSLERCSCPIFNHLADSGQTHNPRSVVQIHDPKSCNNHVTISCSCPVLEAHAATTCAL